MIRETSEFDELDALNTCSIDASFEDGWYHCTLRSGHLGFHHWKKVEK